MTFNKRDICGRYLIFFTSIVYVIYLHWYQHGIFNVLWSIEFMLKGLRQLSLFVQNKKKCEVWENCENLREGEFNISGARFHQILPSNAYCLKKRENHWAVWLFFTMKSHQGVCLSNGIYSPSFVIECMHAVTSVMSNSLWPYEL